MIPTRDGWRMSLVWKRKRKGVVSLVLPACCPCENYSAETETKASDSYWQIPAAGSFPGDTEREDSKSNMNLSATVHISDSVYRGSDWSQFLKKTLQRLKGQITSLVSARTLVPCLIYYFTVIPPLFHHFSFPSPILDCSVLSLVLFADLCCLPSAVTQIDYSRCLVHISLDPFTICVCVCVCVCVLLLEIFYLRYNVICK